MKAINIILFLIILAGTIKVIINQIKLNKLNKKIKNLKIELQKNELQNRLDEDLNEFEKNI